MVRQLGIKGAIPPTANRLKANTVKRKKTEMNIDCFWSVSDSSLHEDYDSLEGLL